MQLLIITLLIICSLSVVAPTASYNPFMRGGKNDVYLTTDSSNGLASYSFTVPFLHIINPTVYPGVEVFYSMEDIQAQIFNEPYPTNPSFFNVEYQFSTSSISSDHMITSITAYLYIPFFKKFSYRYLLFQQGQMWRNTHLVCQNLKFTNGNKLATLPLPSTSTPTSSFYTAYFMSSMKITFQQDDLRIRDDYILIIEWSQVFDASGTYIALSLKVSQCLDRGTFFIVYVGLVIDRTAMQKDFIQYKFIADYCSFIGSNSISMAQFTSSTAQEYYFFGLSRVNFKLKEDPSFDLTLTQNFPSIITLQYNGKTYPAYDNSFAYSYFQFVYFTCKSSSYPIYDNISLSCINCTGNTYLNTSLVACLSCRYDCLTCKNHYQCTSCDSATFRALSSNFSCSPISGYYETNITIAQPCVSPCVTCFNSASQCTSCVGTTTVAISYACVACSTLFEGCSDCKLTYCISCAAGYTQINSTYCNLPCSDSNCLICKNSDTSHCQLCVNTFRLVGNQCLGSCGNGVIQTGQGCDDGNYVLRDGCDNSCMPQPNYNCYQTTVSAITFTTYCAYTKAIDFTILTIQKLPQGNIIQLVLEVKDYQQSFWKNQEVLNCWFIDNIQYAGITGRYLQNIGESYSNKLLTPKLSSYSKGSLVYLQFEYLETIQGKSIIVKFDTSGTAHSSLVQIPSSMKTLIVIPENNHYAYLYSPQIYSKQELLSKLFTGMSIVSYFLLLVSLIMGNKRIIAEYIVLLQIAYASLITLPGYNGMDYALVSLRTASNGFNILEGSAIRPFQDLLSNERTKGMYAYSQFIYNVNLCLIFIIVPLIVGLIASILSCIKSFKEETAKTIQKVKRLSLGQYTYTGLIIGGCSIGLATGLQLQFGKQETDSTLSLISYALPFILLPLFLVYAVFRFKKPQFFGQYHQQLSFTLSSLIFQICISLIGISFGLFLTFLHQTNFVNIIVIAFCLLLFIISLLNRQFKKGLDSYRTQLNLISLIIIQLPFAHTNLYGASQYNSQDDVMILLPVCIAVVLSIGLVLNLALFIYLIIKKIRLYLSQKQQPEQIKEDQKNQSLVSPQKINSGKFRKGFIETQAQESPLQKTTFKDYNNLSLDFQQCKYPNNSILKSIKPTINNQASPQQQACMGTIEQKKFILSTIHKMDEL